MDCGPWLGASFKINVYFKCKKTIFDIVLTHGKLRIFRYLLYYVLVFLSLDILVPMNTCYGIALQDYRTAVWLLAPSYSYAVSLSRSVYVQVSLCKLPQCGVYPPSAHSLRPLRTFPTAWSLSASGGHALPPLWGSTLYPLQKNKGGYR